MNCNNPVIFNPPVFPCAEPPGPCEIETAESLLMMQRQETSNANFDPPLQSQNSPDIPPVQFHDVMESVVDRVLLPIELCIQKGMDAMDQLCVLFNHDAMYAITGYIKPFKNYGQPTQDSISVLMETVPDDIDAMEAITLYVEPAKHYRQPAHDGICVLVETRSTSYALVQPIVEKQLKHCTVHLSRIDDVLTFVPEKDICNAIINVGQPHTRSQCIPKPAHTPRHPRLAHQSVQYKDVETPSDDEPVQKRAKPTPVGSGPSDSRIVTQKTQTDHPKQRPLTIFV